jgi:dTMP kinase
MSRENGVFITFEGGEGGGKTFQLNSLGRQLQNLGLDIVCTREPGGTPISEQIRGVIHSFENVQMVPQTEFLLFQAARAQHVHQVIIPGLQDNKIVLCDRYTDSTLAYQGYGHCLDIINLLPIINFATGGLKPDLTLLFDLPVDVGLNRKKVSGELNRLDALDIEFHKRVREGYLKMVGDEPDRWRVIDASKTTMEVENSVWNEVSVYLRAMGMLGLV